MPMMELTGLTIFIIVLFVGIYATIFGLPGTILIFCDVFFYALATGFNKIGFTVIIILVFMAIIAEAIGVAAEMTGMIQVPSLKGIIASLIGALAGVLLLTPFLLGLGTILGIFLGGFAGLFITEMMRQSKLKPAFRSSTGAIIATVTGIVAKGFFAVAMTVITLLNIYS
jgi:uncharacterized protein